MGRWRAGIQAITSGSVAGELSGTLDPGVEGDGAAQVVAAHRLGQADLSGERAGVGHLGAVEGDEPAPLGPVAVGGVVDADDGHLVVGEQVTLDRLGERRAGGTPGRTLASSSIEATSKSASSASRTTRPVK